MREMKDSGIEWIGEIPKDWEITKIGMLYNLRITKVSDTDYLPLSVTKMGVLPQLETVAKTNAHDDRKLVKKGDFVINSRSDRRGSCGISNYNGSVSLINTVLEPKNNMNSGYYSWLFKTVQFADEFYKNGHGIVDDLWTTGWQDMKRIVLPVPQYSEQQQITDFLDTQCSEIDATAEDIQKEISLLEDYKKSVITEAVTKGLNPDAEMKDSGIEYIGITPIHWNKYRLKYILLERNIRTTTGEEMLLSVSQYKGVVPSKDINNRTMQANSLIGYKIVKKDDLVFNKLNPGLARFGNSEFDGITSPDFSVYIVDDKKCTAKFLQHLLKTYKYVAKIKGDCTGVGDGFARLYSEQLYRFVVSLPPIEELHSIVAYIDSKSSEIDALIADKKRQLDILADYKKSLIYEYVTGKKEVPVNE